MSEPIIVIDTREQLPYEFPGDRIGSVRRALPAGDYSLLGYESEVAVERKSLKDLVGTVIRNRKRFRSELKKLQDYQAACVVVEADLRDVLDRRYEGGVHPHALFGAVVSICVDYSIPVFFVSDRQAACRYVELYLKRFHLKVEACQGPKEAN